MLVAPRIVNDVSYVTDINHESDLTWQAPVAPRIVNDISYVTRNNDASSFSWQAQYLVILECHFSWLAQ